MNHILKPEHGVKICETCGTALHKNGYWYLAGYKSKTEPPCTAYGVPEEWKSKAIEVPFETDGAV